MDKPGSSLHSPGDPFERCGVIFRGVGANDHDAVGVSDVNPVVGHSAPAKTFRQTGDSGGVSYTGTVL